MLTCRVPGMFNEFAAAPEVERLMSSFFASPTATGGAAQAFPPLNVWEDADSLHVEAELPGFSMENLEITTLSNELTIAGSRSEAAPENATFHRRERAAGGSSQFRRTLRIGVPIDADQVTARLEQGVLTVTLPKAAAAKPRKIEVKAG
ncbi:MAG TPA: Hsp20/alpha crystallin family protein [Phycisphaerales bacterium]|nr:Hsp20/alpha crystallin family protein [Phycisphaerales bacterium]